ncbi:hypothetical protein KCP71_08115 [Salmonella enterica subsp. enterica]|nr:hypothetical protein KCP71_08115 [Salmonella enterica subsp. enterica]
MLTFEKVSATTAKFRRFARRRSAHRPGKSVTLIWRCWRGENDAAWHLVRRSARLSEQVVFDGKDITDWRTAGKSCGGGDSAGKGGASSRG